MIQSIELSSPRDLNQSFLPSKKPSTAMAVAIRNMPPVRRTEGSCRRHVYAGCLAAGIVSALILLGVFFLHSPCGDGKILKATIEDSTKCFCSLNVSLPICYGGPG